MMWTWVQSISDAILGRVPGKPGRYDTATRMAMDADFSDRGERRRVKRERPAANVDPLEELQRLSRDEK